MADIFISYAREDREKVATLAKALGDQGWTVWWDPKIRTGTPFDRSIEKALKDARSVLVVWSHHSVDSDWVRAEATDGLSREILISVAIEPNVTPPIRFLNIHTEHLTDWDGKRPSPSFDKIVADLKAILKGQEPPKDTKVPEFEPPRPPQKPTETTGAPAHEVDENLEEEIRQYRQKADSLHATLPVAGFVTHLKVPIDIEEIYVPLHALLARVYRLFEATI